MLEVTMRKLEAPEVWPTAEIQDSIRHFTLNTQSNAKDGNVYHCLTCSRRRHQTVECDW